MTEQVFIYSRDLFGVGGAMASQGSYPAPPNSRKGYLLNSLEVSSYHINGSG